MDNLLSRHRLPGVVQSRQGVERRLTDDGVLAVELTRVLVWEFGIPMAQSVTMVEAALASREDGEARFIAPSAVSLHFPLDRIQERLRIQMLAAMEAVPNVSRGRPRRDR